jgi:NAD(P)-dependent dehydrogenase (short-subunit alcohol dehydrogenase family)
LHIFSVHQKKKTTTIEQTMSSQQVAIITGGSRGLGAEIALSVAKRGVDVIVTFVANEEAANATVAKIQALGRKAAALKLDVAAVSSFDAFVASVKTTLATFGTDRFSFLVNNGGFGGYNPIAATTEENFDALFNAHIKGPYFLTQKLLPLLLDGGCVLNITTGLTRFSMVGYAPYAAAKSALETFTRYLAQELGPRRIRGVALAPGAIATDFGGGHVRDNATVNAMIAGQTPLGRVGESEDIGKAAAAILLDLTWVNAQRIEASGGIHP